MAVSGTYNFNLDIDQVIQEATEMIGGEQTLGHEPASARRSINLMLKDWQNRGVLLWTTETTAVTVAASTTTYDLSSSTIDALEVVLNRDSTDLQLERISPEEYLLIPNKTQTGRPSQYSIRRGRDNPVLSVWPIPENSTDIMKIERISELQDVDKSAGQNADMPTRFLPPLTCGLAYYMSMKGYTRQFKSKLGYIPYPGTLNVQLTEKKFSEAISQLSNYEGIKINSFSDGKRTFGWVKCFKSKINNKIDCELILLERTHHDATIVEFISKNNIRKSLKIGNKSNVKVKISILGNFS